MAWQTSTRLPIGGRKAKGESERWQRRSANAPGSGRGIPSLIRKGVKTITSERYEALYTATRRIFIMMYAGKRAPRS